MPSVNAPVPWPELPAALHLGLDAGGTETRWALADSAGALQAEGVAPPLSGLMLLDDAGQAALATALQALSTALPARVSLRAAWAGVTGLGPAQAAELATRVAQTLGLPEGAVTVASDVELAYRAAWAPGEGLLVYAGTGSIAAQLAPDGTLQRAGGRGAVIDDAGGGHWLAREALRLVWRAEDEQPGAGIATPLGRALARAVGGDDWATTRAFVYGASRGELGVLARTVATAADEGDGAALQLLQQAGRELARLAQALHRRLGPALPVALAGRVFELHPAVEASLRDALPGVTVRRSREPAHHAAARLAAALEPSR
jgi:glucosamine kinase